MPMLAGILLLEVDFRAGWMLMEEILKKKKSSKGGIWKPRARIFICMMKVDVILEQHRIRGVHPLCSRKPTFNF